MSEQMKNFQIHLGHDDRAEFIEKLKWLLTPFPEVFAAKDVEITQLRADLDAAEKNLKRWIGDVTKTPE